MYVSIVGWGNINQQCWNPLGDGDNEYPMYHIVGESPHN